MSGKDLYNYAHLIRKVTIPNAATTIVIDNVSLEPGKIYKLYYNLINAIAGPCFISYYLNGDLVAANYYRTECATVAGGAWTLGYANDSAFAGPQLLDDIEVGEFTIFIGVDGKPRILQSTNAWAAAVLGLEFKSHLYDVAVPRITRIEIVASVASGLGAGSNIALFGMES